MIFLKGIYDSSAKKLMINFSFGFLDKYWDFLEKTFEEEVEKGNIPKNSEIDKGSENACIISIPVDIPGSEKFGDGERMDNVPKEITGKVAAFLGAFKDTIFLHEFGHLEFIPLTGYPKEKLKTDIERAVSEKKDLCLIDSYSSYKKFVKLKNDPMTELKYKKIKFANPEYAEVAWYCNMGKIGELKNLIGNLETVEI